MDYKKIIRNRETRLKLISLLRFIPDKIYLKLTYKIKTGKKLNFKNPTGFNEKLNWLKIYDRKSAYSDYVDKYKVRGIIKERIGEEYLFPLLGKYDKFDEIDFDKLPNQFVIKCNHDSGSVKIIKDKSQINKKELRKFFNNRLKINPYCIGREYPYKNVKTCIIIEKYMQSVNGEGINDYKFFCFDGKPIIMFIATDRAKDVKFDFFDMDFNHLDIVNIHPQADQTPKKPICFDKMKEIAGKLSEGFKFMRVDLYEIDGKIYFGEFTFYHAGGFWLFHPEEWEKKLGDLIVL